MWYSDDERRIGCAEVADLATGRPQRAHPVTHPFPQGTLMEPLSAWLRESGVVFALAETLSRHPDAELPPPGNRGHADHATESLRRVLRGPGFLDPGALVWEPGCGAGSLSIEAARQGASVRGSDVDPRLLAFARQAARRAGLKVDWRAGAFLEPYPPDECPDLVVANLPQKPGPGGARGDEICLEFVRQASCRLARGSRVLFMLHTFVGPAVLRAWNDSFQLTLLAWKRRHLAPGEVVAPGGLIDAGAVYGGVWLAVRQ